VDTAYAMFVMDQNLWSGARMVDGARIQRRKYPTGNDPCTAVTIVHTL